MKNERLNLPDPFGGRADLVFNALLVDRSIENMEKLKL